MKTPAALRQLVNALNQEQEFAPDAIPGRRLAELPDGKNLVIDLLPYWMQLRNNAMAMNYSLALAAARRAPSMGRRSARDLSLSDLRAQADALNQSSPAVRVAPDNDYRRAQDIFIRTIRYFVESWLQSGKNTARCFREHQDIERTINGFLLKNPLVLVASSSVGPSLLVSPVGPFRTKNVRRGKDMPTARAKREAIALFIDLIRHSLCDRLGRCGRCQRYFFGRPNQKCCPRPRRCGSYLAAIETTKKRWKSQRQQKLNRAREACAKWSRLKVKGDWKLWVARKIGVTAKWLTRAANAGELAPPGKADPLLS